MDTFNEISLLSIITISTVVALSIMGAPIMEAPLSHLLNLALVGGVAIGCMGIACSVFALMMGTEEQEVSLTEAMEQAWTETLEEIELMTLVSKHRHMLAGLGAEVATSTKLVARVVVTAIRVANGPQLQGRMHRPVLSALPQMRC